jgi:hypothetical protein
MSAQRSPEEYKAAYEHHKAQGNLDKAQRVADLYRQHLKSQQEPDNAFEYSVDQAQRMGGKGIEAIGRATGHQGVEDYGTGVVEQQDQDIAQGGYTPKYTKSLRDTYNEDGIGSAVGWLGEKTAENSVSGGVALAGGLGTAAVATVSTPAAAVLGLGTLAASGTMGAGEAAFEQENKVGDYDSALAVGQGVLIGILDKFGAGKVIPKSKLIKMTPKQVIDELEKKGFKKAASEVAKKTAYEGATEVAQEGVSIAGAANRGGEYDQRELEDRGLESFALGSTNAGMAQGVVGGARLVTGKPANLSDRAAQATFAQRLDRLAKDGNAEGKAFNLNDVDTKSENGVRALLDLAHTTIASDINVAKKDLSEQLNENDPSLSSSERASIARINTLLKQAVNKTKSVIGRSDFQKLEELVGHLPDGRRLINLVKESQEQTKVWNSGMKGGVSQFTDRANPLQAPSNYGGNANVNSDVRLLSTGLAGSATGGASLGMQGAVFVGGRLIDKVSGRRSKVKRYIKNNRKNQGMAEVTGIGERDKAIARTKKYNDEALKKAQQKTASERAMHYYNYTQNAPAHPDSPQGMYQRFTGLDKAGLENTIDEVVADRNVDPTIRLQLEELVESMKFGGRVSGFAALRHINGVLDRMPPESNPRVAIPEDRMPNGVTLQAAEAQYVQAMPYDIHNGMVSNNNEVLRLKEELAADDSVSTEDKELLNAALDKMLATMNDPVKTVINVEQSLIWGGVSMANISKYFKPYKDRVFDQQGMNEPTQQ